MSQTRKPDPRRITQLNLSPLTTSRNRLRRVPSRPGTERARAATVGERIELRAAAQDGRLLAGGELSCPWDRFI